MCMLCALNNSMWGLIQKIIHPDAQIDKIARPAFLAASCKSRQSPNKRRVQVIHFQSSLIFIPAQRNELVC